MHTGPRARGDELGLYQHEHKVGFRATRAERTSKTVEETLCRRETVHRGREYVEEQWSKISKEADRRARDQQD